MELPDRVLVRAALAVALIGLLGLFALRMTAQLPLEPLDAVALAREGGPVRVAGTVVSSRVVGNVTLLTLEALVERDAVIFAPHAIPVGASVEVTGAVQEYRGEPELVVETLSIR